MDLTYPCYVQEYAYCSKLLDPDVDSVSNDAYFADILELDPEDYENLDHISDERLWWKANPIRMSYENGRQKIRDAYKLAKEIPEKMTAFLTKMLNIWVQAQRKRLHGYGEMESLPGGGTPGCHKGDACICRLWTCRPKST